MQKEGLFSKPEQIGAKNVPIEDIFTEETEYAKGGNLAQLKLFDETENGPVIDIIEKMLRIK